MPTAQPTLEARAAAMRDAVRTNATRHVLRLLAHASEVDPKSPGGVRRSILTRRLTVSQRPYLDGILDELVATGRVEVTTHASPAKPWRVRTVYRWRSAP